MASANRWDARRDELAAKDCLWEVVDLVTGDGDTGDLADRSWRLVVEVDAC